MNAQNQPPQDKFAPILTPEQKIQAELKIMEEAGKEAASSPEKARAFLQRAGILDESGKLAAPYHD
jgi:hypothetical protein